MGIEEAVGAIVADSLFADTGAEVVGGSLLGDALVSGGTEALGGEFLGAAATGGMDAGLSAWEMASLDGMDAGTGALAMDQVGAADAGLYGAALSGMDAGGMELAGLGGADFGAATSGLGALGSGGDTLFSPFDINQAVSFGSSGTGAGASSGLWGDVRGALQLAAPIMSIGSGIYGMSLADTLRKQALLAQQNGAASAGQSTPFDTSGSRGLANEQIQALMKDPSQVAAQDPSYALRMQAAKRATAAQGQGSGAMAVQAANASTDWYNQRLNSLGSLAGAQFSPAAAGQQELAAAQIGLSGSAQANQLTSQALASLGYGVTQASMPNYSAMTPAMQQRLIDLGITY